MKSLVVVGALALLCGASAAAAEPDCPRWTKAQAVLNGAFPDIQANGLKAVGHHQEDFEQVLADMDKPCPEPIGDTVDVLTDGMMETLVILASAAKQHPGKKVVAVENPYPPLTLLLGSYYVEIHRYGDAVRVFDRERATNKGNAGATRPGLTTERAAALGQLRRFEEALAAYDEGLTLLGLDDKDKARMQRGRGFILTELERLEEAEAAYRESLKLEPGNPLARQEIEYIHTLLKGGGRAPVGAPILTGDQPKPE